MSCKITTESRKPATYRVLTPGNHGGLLANHGGLLANHGGLLAKNPDPKAPRCDRWRMLADWGGGTLTSKSFPSKRAALYFFEFGKTFKTNPVFAVIGGRRSQKRVR